MNERIKELRNALGLSGEKFGERLGVQRNAVSRWETGKNNVPEQSIKSICREFNVNEQWLRTGEGEMFTPVESLSLDELVDELEPIELEILKAYFSLDKDVRKKAVEHFRKVMMNDDEE